MTNKTILTLVLISGFFISANCLAAENESNYSADYKSCNVAANRNGNKLTACDKDELDRQNLKLNQYYKILYGKLSPYRRGLLQKSENVWIKFRDSECDFKSSQAIGGPLGIEDFAQKTEMTYCMLDETSKRVITLKYYLAHGLDGEIL